MTLSPLTLTFVCFAAFAAGVIDAIAGGGGLITVPALLSAGVPVQFLFGTNKGAAVFGASASLFRFWRAGAIDKTRARGLFALGFIGSLLGAYLITQLDTAMLKPLVLVLLVAAGIIVTVVRPKPGAVDPKSVRHAALKAAFIALVIGAYDGFFGPGTGTFLIIAFVTVLHLTLSLATANAKVVNFASNLAAVGVFVLNDQVLWQISLPMAASNFLGGSLGAHLAVKGGDRLIRIAVLGVVIALAIKIGLDVLHQ